jgi:hypothetical protein
MEILYCIIGIAFGITSVFFYVLGLSHGRKVEKGLQVKLEPVKSIVHTIEDIKEEREDKEKSKETNDMLKKLLYYNGGR